MGNQNEQEEQMRAVSILLIVCGLVIIVAKVWELATNSLTMPYTLFLGPLFLIGGIYVLATQKNKPTKE
jgi:uncharacterized membrane protein